MTSEVKMPVIGYANVIDGKMHGGMPYCTRYNDSPVVLQSAALAAIEAARVEAHTMAMKKAAAVVYEMDYSGLSSATIVQKLRSLAKEAP